MLKFRWPFIDYRLGLLKPTCVVESWGSKVTGIERQTWRVHECMIQARKGAMVEGFKRQHGTRSSKRSETRTILYYLSLYEINSGCIGLCRYEIDGCVNADDAPSYWWQRQQMTTMYGFEGAGASHCGNTTLGVHGDTCVLLLCSPPRCDTYRIALDIRSKM